MVVEGWYRGMGYDYSAYAPAVLEVAKVAYEEKGVRTGVLVTENYSPSTYSLDCSNADVRAAYTLFKSYNIPNSLFNYQTADLSITNKKIPPACDRSDW